MPDDDVLFEKRADGIGLITLNRPDSLNSLGGRVIPLLGQFLDEAEHDRAVRAVVLTGAGRGFCAGGDVKRMADGAIDYDAPDAVAILRRKMEVARLLHELPQPTVAMVNGPAAGAGLALALACDLRLAGASARFVTGFARVGLPGDFGGSYFLTAALGPAKARELYLTGDAVDAATAERIGLVLRTVPDAMLAEQAQALARRLAAGPPLAYRYMKRNLDAARTQSLSSVLDLEAEHQAAASRSADHREAARAFLDKRPPVFAGR